MMMMTTCLVHIKPLCNIKIKHITTTCTLLRCLMIFRCLNFFHEQVPAAVALQVYLGLCVRVRTWTFVFLK